MTVSVTATIDREFAGDRPVVFTRDPVQCPECSEHEATRSRITPLTISLTEVGNPGWDPLCFAANDAFRYFMPGLARLALGTGGTETTRRTRRRWFQGKSTAQAAFR